MKRIKEILFHFFVRVYGLHLVVWLNSGILVRIDKLPRRALFFIEKYLPGSKIMMIWMKTKYFSIYYEVILGDGTVLKFNSNGRRISIY